MKKTTINLKYYLPDGFNHFCTTTVLLCFSSLVFASESSNHFNLLELADGIYVHSGKHVSVEDEQHDDIANIGFIVGSQCIAVIDTGGSVKTGQRLLASIRSISDKPVCYVINTHIHFDHILGNQAFAAEGTVFVGHQKLSEAVEQNREFFLERFKNNLGSNPNKNSIIGPDSLVEQSKKIDLGERILTLIAFPAAHSYNDLIVIDDKTKTLWAGDLIFRERIPSLTASIKGWIKAMESLRQLDVNTVIPGHGSPADSITEASAKQQAYLEKLLTETRQAIAEGKFVNDAVEAIDKDNESGWLLHEYQHPINVNRAYTELEWE